MTPAEKALQALDRADEICSVIEEVPPLPLPFWIDYQKAKMAYSDAAAEARSMLQNGYAQIQIIERRKKISNWSGVDRRSYGVDRRGKS